MKNIIKIIPITIILLLGGCTGSHSELYQSSNMQMKTPSGLLLSHFKDDLDENCQSGNTKDCEYLANYYYDRKDENNMLKYSNLACKNGLKKACTFVDEYKKQKTEKLRKEEAKQNKKSTPYAYKGKVGISGLKESCYDGNAYSCTLVGMMYDEGGGVEQDIQKGRYFFRKACYAGADDICKLLQYQGISY